MNLLVCTNLDIGTPPAAAAIPHPRTARRAPGESVRVLFINARELGFGTTGRTLERVTAERPDIEAVHFSIHMPLWLRAVCWETPLKRGRIDFHAWRMMQAWAVLLKPYLTGPLSLDRFDVVHIFTQQRSLAASRLVAARGNRPASMAKLVVNVDATFSGWDRAFEVRTHATPLQLRMERSIYEAAAASGGAIACASRWVADSVVGDSGISPERVFLHMPCAARLPGVVPRRPDAHVGRAGPLRMIFVGNAWERKGGPRLLRWHQERWADRAELHICSGEAVPDRTARSVVWHGRVDHDRLIRELLPTMDLFVMPTFEDTFLIAAQESELLGVPVVSSRLAGIPEVVIDGQTGLLCPRKDDHAFVEAIERVIGDPNLLTQFSRAAAAHADRNLNAGVWHTHLIDQLVAIADERAVTMLPEGMDATSRE